MLKTQICVTRPLLCVKKAGLPNCLLSVAALTFTINTCLLFVIKDNFGKYYLTDTEIKIHLFRLTQNRFFLIIGSRLCIKLHVSALSQAIVRHVNTKIFSEFVINF